MTLEEGAALGVKGTEVTNGVRDPGSGNESPESEDDEELAAVVAASIQQTHQDNCERMKCEGVDEEELAAAVAASIQQTHQDKCERMKSEGVDEAMLARAIEASLAAEEGAVAENGNTGHERAWSGRATEPQGQGLLENPKSSAVNLT